MWRFSRTPTRLDDTAPLRCVDFAVRWSGPRPTQWNAGRHKAIVALAVLITMLTSSANVHGQADSQLGKALGFTPRLKDSVVYQKVDRSDVAKYEGKTTKINGVEGYLVTGPNGETLRWFCDNNGDRAPDQWSYFNNGMEVHREIDSDYNGKADEYRWLGSGGLRWGIDKNEDGRVDRWKQISAEEVTLEIVNAIRNRDIDMFRTLVLSDSELRDLGLSKSQSEQLADRAETAVRDFATFVRAQDSIDQKTRWTNFAADKPGVIPSGTEGSTKDFTAYENVVAVFENAQGEPQQLLVGSLLQVDGGWRIVDVPKVVTSGAVVSNRSVLGLISFGGNSSVIPDGGMATAGISEKMQELLTDLDRIDTQLASSKADERPRLHENRANLLEQLISGAGDENERETWVKQFADTVSAATQSGEYPAGLKRLERLRNGIESSRNRPEYASYIAFRCIEAEYSLEASNPKADFEEIEKKHLKQLEDFVKEYPKSNDSAEALVRIGLSNELAGDSKTAQAFYRRAAAEFPKTRQGEKAGGAIARLNLVGQKMRLNGTTVDGKKFDSFKLGDRPMVIHYWATWCGPCKSDMEQLRRLQAQYARQGLTLVGINVDDDPKMALKYLQADGRDFVWPHLHEQGGMESSLAVKLGVFSLPVTLVVDKKGEVVVSATHLSPDVKDAVADLFEK